MSFAETIQTDGYNDSNYLQRLERYMSEEKKTESLPEWITTTEAAEIMGITQNAVGHLCRKGKIKARHHGTGHRSTWEVWRKAAESYEVDYGGRPRKKKSND